MRLTVKILELIALLLALALPAMAADYDLVILNGGVMDPETMLDAKLVYGSREDKDGKSGSNVRSLITSRFNF